jgi:hypothetical protein
MLMSADYLVDSCGPFANRAVFIKYAALGVRKAAANLAAYTGVVLAD